MDDYGPYTAAGSTLPVVEAGLVRGRIKVPPALAEITKIITDKFWAQMVSEEFSEETVDAIPVPALVRLFDWIPHAQLGLMGLKASMKPKDQHLVMTSSCVEHDDHMLGLTLMWVLRTGGALAFRQTNQGPWHWHEVGDWYLFDDRVLHEVEVVKKNESDPEPEFEAVYCAWCVKLEHL